MRIQIILFLCLTSLCQLSFSQIKRGRRIVYISLKDTTLINTIESVIKRESASADTNNLFKKGFGYVRLAIISYKSADTSIKYYISPELSFIRKDAADGLYPDYYSYVNSNLVVIYDGPLRELTREPFLKKDKMFIRQIIDQRLEKPQKRTFFDMQQKEIFTDRSFRIDYFRANGGVYLYILKNKPPLVVNE